MAKKLPGRGTVLSWKSGSAFVVIAQRVTISGPSSEVKMRDTTDLDSVYVEKRPAIADLGKLSLKLFFDPNDVNQAALRAKLYAPSQTPDEFNLVYKDGLTTTSATDDLKGFLTKWEPNGMEVEGTLGADVEIDLTDSYGFTPGV